MKQLDIFETSLLKVMSAIFILIGASIVVASGFLIAFIWSVKTGQYEDDYTPSVRMLFDNIPPAKNQKKLHNQDKTLTELNTQSINTINNTQ